MKNKKFWSIFSISLATLTLGGVISAVSIKTLDTSHTCEVGTNLAYSSTSHFYTCTNEYCANKFYEEEHDLEWVIDKEETFEENGIKHEICKTCNYKRNVGTVIDDIYNSNHISVKDNLVRYQTVNSYVDGSGDMSPEFIVGTLKSNEHSNVSFTSRYELVTDNGDGTYTYSNVLNTRIYYTTPGFAFYDANGNVFKIMLRIYPQNENRYSLDIASDLGRYRLISNDVNALCEDFLSCGYVDIDFGVYEVNNLGNVYGIRFKTANKELSYLSDNSGTIKNDTEFFKCSLLESTDGEKTTIKNVLGWLETDGVYEKDSSGILLRSTQMSGKKDYGSLVTCKDASNWLIEKVKYLTWLNK